MPKRVSITALLLCCAVALFSGCKEDETGKTPDAGAQAEQTGFEKDVIKTNAGDIEITFIGHGTLMLDVAGQIVHVDPWTRLADYSTMPRADVILVTHEHGDHLDVDAVSQTKKDNTAVILTEAVAEKLAGGIVMKNGDVRKVGDIGIEAVPAYNIEHKRASGEAYHPKGRGNGYVLTFGGKRVYIAGDTENTPEMKAMKDIDAAFLPMNLPYTMTPQMVAEAAKAFKPKILYPYHYGETDTAELANLLADTADIEVRVRRMK